MYKEVISKYSTITSLKLDHLNTMSLNRCNGPMIMILLLDNINKQIN